MPGASRVRRSPRPRAPRVAVVPIGAVGHLNPMLAVTSALLGRRPGPHIRVYAPAGTAPLFMSTGAQFEKAPASPAGDPLERLPGAPLSALAVRSFLSAQEGLGELVRSMREFRPDVVVHDVFDLRGAVAARALGVPAASLLPFAGLRALGSRFAEDHGQHHPALLAANDRLICNFGVDILGDDACLPVLFPSRNLSIVTALQRQSPPADPVAPDRLEAIEALLGSALKWVGPCLGDRHWGGDAIEGLPLAEAGPGRLRRARTVLFSMGTNIATFRRSTPVGGARSGSDFVGAAVDLLLSALGDKPDYRLLVATGGWRGDPARGWPSNATVAQVLPQRRLLAGVVDVFVTHHGYNSTMEATFHEVPMVAFPGYGDQVANAEFSVRSGVSVAHWDLRNPVSTCTTGGLRKAIDQAVSPTGPAAALSSLRRELFSADGASAAAQLILGLV